MLNYRTLAILIAAGLLALGLGASGNTPTFNTRWSNSMTDIATTQTPIPHEKLHAKALEILRGRTVAADDEANK
jgi:hypothetical protein